MIIANAILLVDYKISINNNNNNNISRRLYSGRNRGHTACDNLDNNDNDDSSVCPSACSSVFSSVFFLFQPRSNVSLMSSRRSRNSQTALRTTMSSGRSRNSLAHHNVFRMKPKQPCVSECHQDEAETTLRITMSSG